MCSKPVDTIDFLLRSCLTPGYQPAEFPAETCGEIIVWLGSAWGERIVEVLTTLAAIREKLAAQQLWNLPPCQIVVDLARLPGFVGLQLRGSLCGGEVLEEETSLISFLFRQWARHGWRLFGIDTLAGWLDELEKRKPALVSGVRARVDPSVLWLSFRGLIAEAVPVNDLATLLEAVLDSCRLTQDPEMLGEFMRVATARQIVEPLVRDGRLPVVTVSSAWEQELQDSIHRSDQGSFVTLDPTRGQLLLESIDAALQSPECEGSVILCRPPVRSALRKLLTRSLPHVTVLSWNEIPDGYDVDVSGWGTVE